MSKVIEGLSDAIAYARIDALLKSTKKKRGEDVTSYDWGYRDGLMAARAIFATERIVKVKPARSKR